MYVYSIEDLLERREEETCVYVYYKVSSFDVVDPHSANTKGTRKQVIRFRLSGSKKSLW